MAKSLKLTIELAGAEEIKRQLEGVGEAGEEAFSKIVKAAQNIGGFKNLDPSTLKDAYADLATKAPEAIGKITQAVKSATRMETLVNALTGVENGLARVQAAASSVDAVLGKALLSSITKIARFLPAAFAAATIGAIANTVNELLKLDAAAIKAGVSIETMSKLTGIFKAIGASAAEASKGVAAFFDAIETAKIKEATKAVEDIKKELASGWFGWEGFKTLERLAQGTGKGAEFARDKLREFGREAPVLDPLIESIQKILTSTENAEVKFNQLMAIFFQMGNTAQRNAAILSTFGDAMGTTIIQAMNAGLTLDQLNTLLGKVPAQSQAATDAAVRLSLAWQQFKNLLASGFSVSVEGLNDLVTILGAVNTALQAVGTAVTFVNEQLRAIGMGNMFQSTIAEINQVINLLASIGQIGFAAMKYIEAGAIAAWQTIIGWINKAIDAVKQFFSMGGGKAMGGAGGMARGGIMGGRGTGTSDSNLAWLSRGEHVMPARAVAAPGVLAFLEALRRSGGNLRGVLDRMGHFAMGGMVSAPAFAHGGSVGGMSNVTIQFPGVQPITGLRASSAVVDELRRSAALAQVRSGGRKPSRYT